ncbi:zinc finger protein 572-like [Trichogramma pretiosum]|uniref:zinc finger protein 572-like n=1 Tax=Trichogramma pretiosum TaxID=7493 RepID=UPI000C71B5B5|nr:zinc finger protein 572-like [Trichogramma pretiosum]
MESTDDAVRAEEESIVTWFENYDFDSADSWKYREILSSCELTARSEKKAEVLQESALLEEESSADSKAENQSFQPVARTENDVRTNIQYEKTPIIVIKRGFDYYNNRHFDVNPRLKLAEYEKPKIEHISTRCNRRIRPRQCMTCECDICPQSFNYQGILEAHLNTFHDRNDRKKFFMCDICQKSFEKKFPLDRHINAVHDHNKPFECEICHKSFSTKSYINTQISSVHDRIKPFECDTCHKSFGQKEYLKTHISTVHNRSKPFECENCHKLFSRRSHLNVHMNAVHNRSKPFECKICHKSFGIKSNLKTHIIAVHNRNTKRGAGLQIILISVAVLFFYHSTHIHYGWLFMELNVIGADCFYYYSWSYISLLVPAAVYATNRSAQKLLSACVAGNGLLHLGLAVYAASQAGEDYWSKDTPHTFPEMHSALRYLWHTLFGCVNAPVLPCVYVLLARLVPDNLRATIGSVILNIKWLGLFSAFLSAFCVNLVGLRHFDTFGVYMIFGVLAPAWAIVYWFVGANCDMEIVNRAPGFKPKVPWRPMLASLPVGCLIVFHSLYFFTQLCTLRDYSTFHWMAVLANVSSDVDNHT